MKTEEKLKDMDWIERGRYRRAAKYYLTQLIAISRAKLLNADALRESAARAVYAGKRRYKKPGEGRKPTP